MIRYVNSARLNPFDTDTEVRFALDDGIGAFRPEKLIITAERARAWYDHSIARFVQRWVVVPWWCVERRFVMTKEAFAESMFANAEAMLANAGPTPEDLDRLERERLEGDPPDDDEEIDNESTTGTWHRQWIWNPYRPLARWVARIDAEKMGAALKNVWVKQINIAGEDQLFGDDALPASMFTAISFGQLDLRTARRDKSIKIKIQGACAHSTMWSLIGLVDV